MGPTAQKRACGVAAPLLPHRTRTGNAVARATHGALPGVQVSMQSRQHDLLAPTVCEPLCRKMQCKRAPPWPHGVAQGRSPNVWCSMDPRYAGECNGNAGAGGTPCGGARSPRGPWRPPRGYHGHGGGRGTQHQHLGNIKYAIELNKGRAYRLSPYAAPLVLAHAYGTQAAPRKPLTR